MSKKHKTFIKNSTIPNNILELDENDNTSEILMTLSGDDIRSAQNRPIKKKKQMIGEQTVYESDQLVNTNINYFTSLTQPVEELPLEPLSEISDPHITRTKKKPKQKIGTPTTTNDIMNNFGIVDDNYMSFQPLLFDQPTNMMFGNGFIDNNLMSLTSLLFGASNAELTDPHVTRTKKPPERQIKDETTIYQLMSEFGTSPNIQVLDGLYVNTSFAVADILTTQYTPHRVGINTAFPTQTLDVNGTVRITSLTPNQVVVTDSDKVLYTIPFSVASDPNTFVLRDDQGNVFGTNITGGSAITLLPVGTTPNIYAAQLIGSQLELEPADQTNPGLVSITAQTLSGKKTFINDIVTMGTMITDYIESYTTTLNIAQTGTTQTLNLGCANGMQTVNIGQGVGVKTINIGNSGDTVNIGGDMNYINTTDVFVSAKTMTLNIGSTGSGTARGAGIYIRDNNSDVQSYILVSNTTNPGQQFVFKAPENSYLLYTPVITSDSTLLVDTGDLNLSGTVTFSSLSASSVLTLNATKTLTATQLLNGQIMVGSGGNNPVATTITGTTDEIIVTNGAGSITLSTPQAIGTTSNVTFNNLILSGLTASSPIFTDVNKQLTNTGVVPISNGGTNSSTALNNHRIMYSSGGSIVEAAALGNGQLLIGSTLADPVAATISGTTNRITVTTGPGSITLSAPQDIAQTSIVTFAGLILTGLTASLPVFTSASKSLTNTGVVPIGNGGTNSTAALNNNSIMVSSGGAIVESGPYTDGQILIGATSSSLVKSTITGTTNRVTVTNGPGSITLSAPQDIATTSNVTFNGLNLTGLTASLPIFTDSSKNLTNIGIVPVANGGTNSGTALNNNRIMVSSGGSIVETTALTNGQLLIGSTGNAPVIANITGTTNRVTVTNGPGTISLTGPQDIAPTSNVTFNSMVLNTYTKLLSAAPVTTTGSASTLFAIPVGTSVSLTCQFNINVINTTANQTGGFTGTFTVYNNAGALTISQIANYTSILDTSLSAASVSVTSSGANLLIQVNAGTGVWTGSAFITSSALL